MPGLGLHVGPHFPERQTKFKEAKAKRKKMKSRAKAEKERKKKRPERQKRKADKVKRRAQKKEEERLKRAERGEPEVIKVKKSATNSHHGTEQIDSTILKLLRKSHRSKKEVPQKKENKVGRPEVASQWRGVREERHEASQEKKQRKRLKPNTPSPRHFLPDDSSSLQIPISAETSTLQQSFPEDPSSQDHHPRTPSPRHFLPDDLCSQDQHPRTPSPRHYYPEDVLPLRNVISAEQPTLQQPSKTPSPDHFSSLQTPLSAERPTSTSKKLTLNPNALHIYGTNAKVNARNDAKLKEIGGELFKIKAKNASRTVKKFHINSAGCIRNTPFQDELRIKVGCDIVLVHNINTLDGLTNGCRGVLVAVEKTGEAIKRLIIKFNNPEHGRLQREKNPCHRHPQATYIDPIHWQYFLGGATATVFQFPVRGAAAITAHKIQVSYFDN